MRQLKGKNGVHEKDVFDDIREDMERFRRMTGWNPIRVQVEARRHAVDAEALETMAANRQWQRQRDRLLQRIRRHSGGFEMRQTMALDNTDTEELRQQREPVRQEIELSGEPEPSPLIPISRDETGSEPQ